MGLPQLVGNPMGPMLLTPIMVAGVSLISSAMYEVRADGVLMVDDTGTAVAAVVAVSDTSALATIRVIEGPFWTGRGESGRPPPADFGLSTNVELLW